MKAMRFWSALAVAVLCLRLGVSAFPANRVTKITMDVTLCPDGAVRVVQIWDGIFWGGTECYFPVICSEGATLHELIVSDAGGSYRILDNWKVDATFEEKAGKCGLRSVDGGYEICWGISAYGNRRYTVEYRLDGLVNAYEDSDGFLFQFVSAGMETLPTDVSICIRMQDGTPLTAENTAIRTFGFEGHSKFTRDGQVVVDTTDPLIRKEEHVSVILRLHKGVVTPAHTVDGSFARVWTRAMEGCAYGRRDNSDFAIFFLFFVPFVIGLLWGVGGSEKRSIQKRHQAVDDGHPESDCKKLNGSNGP